MVYEFQEYLKDKELSKNTIMAYQNALKQFYDRYDSLTRENLRDYKMYLIENYKPQTVNLRIRAMNCYLEYLKKDSWKLSTIKIQQKPFLENVISEADYLYFKNCLLKDGEIFWYFVIRFMAATGARVSELVKIKVEHVKLGYLDLYSKGGKLRRIYFPAALRKEALAWFKDTGLTSGFIFLNKHGNPLTARWIGNQLKFFAEKYGLDLDVIYPHSFRHRFAKSFLDRYNDITMLSDLMGHESIETTRIYLRKTSTEQQAIIDQVVDW